MFILSIDSLNGNEIRFHCEFKDIIQKTNKSSSFKERIIQLFKKDTSEKIVIVIVQTFSYISFQMYVCLFLLNTVNVLPFNLELFSIAVR